MRTSKSGKFKLAQRLAGTPQEYWIIFGFISADDSVPHVRTGKKNYIMGLWNNSYKNK